MAAYDVRWLLKDHWMCLHSDTDLAMIKGDSAYVITKSTAYQICLNE